MSNNQAPAAVARAGRGVVTVVPLTSNTAKVLSFQVFLPREDTGLSRDSKAQPEQIRSVSLERIGQNLGDVPAPLMNELSEAIRQHLNV